VSAEYDEPNQDITTNRTQGETTLVKVPSGSEAQKEQSNQDAKQSGSYLELDKIWTPAYYGDDKHGMGHRTGLYSDEHGNLKVTVGKKHRTFDVKWNGDRYEVEIDGSRFTGRYLSNLTEDANRVFRDEKSIVTTPRKCASVVYHRDLVTCAGDKQIDKSSLRMCDKVIGKGWFGEVTLAKYTNPSGVKSKVAIKRVSQTSPHALVGAMEVAVLSELAKNPNDNLIRLVGWYLDTDALCMVTEYMPGGCLANYLEGLYNSSDLVQQREFRGFVKDIATGMRALEKWRIQHRNLAARNILLDANKRLK
uniref:Protein kinase domain-containing protein n=1 Tax=Mesocestoides corti TaxID=53468 RepID=A0A5K3F454_MESCO